MRKPLRRPTSALLAAAVACIAFAATRYASQPVIAASSPAPAETRAVERSRAQEAVQPQFTIQARVPLTIVDVTVTDAKGQPVHGLKESDFTILEDNKEMKPNSFEEHRSDEAPPAPTLVKQDLPPNTFTNLSPTPPDTGPINILLLDNLNTPTQVQQRVQLEMLDYLKRMPPGTRMAVLGLTYRLFVVQGITTDSELLKAAILSKKNIAPTPPMQDPRQDSAAPDINAPQVGDTTCDPVYTNLMAMRAQYTLNAMRQMARYLSGMPGRKNLIWFSGSFPPKWEPETGVCYDFTSELTAATGVLANAHVVINPIDSRGLRVDNNTNRRLLEEHYNMDLRADQTGGHAVYTSNDLAGAVDNAVNLGSNYYTLTYTPTDKALDTRFRTISVKVDQPGLHLDYRNGYYAVDPTTDARGKKIETVSPMQTAMMRGALDATQILFKVKATEAAATEVALPIHNVPNPRQMKPPYRHYSVTYTIDIANIQFTPAPDGTYRAGFEFGIRVYNADGDEIVNSASKEAHPILTPAAYQSLLKTGAVSHDEIDVPAKGEFFLRIAVHDFTSDRVGSMEIPTSSIKSDPAPAVASGQNP